MKYPLLLSLMGLLFSCGDKKPAGGSPAVAKTDSVAAAKQYFPVMDFIKGEIADVDSLPVGIKKYIGPDRKKGFVYIKPDEFHRLALEFVPPETADSLFRKAYLETSFLDKSSNSATFFYATKNDSLPLKRVDVLTARGDAYDQVKSIYLQKSYRSGDTAYIKKLYWKPQHSFQIITQATRDAQNPVTEIINVVWDNSEE